MPELPEAETIRRDLEKILTGARVVNASVVCRSSVRSPAREFRNRLSGRKLLGVNRRGKALMFDFGRIVLVSRLGMTGQLVLGGGDDEYARAKIEFTGGRILIYRDARKFGFLELLEGNAIKHFTDKFGPEPLDAGFTPAKFEEIVRKYPRGALKVFLLNQRRIGGLGNIYADEICFRAGVSPARRTGALSDAETKSLYFAMRKVLRDAIKGRGTSFRDYVDAKGKRGKFINRLAVYGRAGLPCVVCRAPIVKVRIAGRGTHYCRRCQK